MTVFMNLYVETRFLIIHSDLTTITCKAMMIQLMAGFGSSIIEVMFNTFV